VPISPLFATQTPTNAAVPISDGSGSPNASLDDWVSNGSGAVGDDYVPVGDGAEPMTIMSNGAGEPLLVPYTP